MRPLINDNREYDIASIYQEKMMSFVEIERNDGIMVVRLNRPERMNSLGTELRNLLADAWCEFRDSKDLEVAIFTGTGRAFCAGEDMKESVEKGHVGSSAEAAKKENPYNDGTLDKPVIVAINGFAMGGGFMLTERGDFRVSVRGATFESSEAKRWLLGGHSHGIVNNLPHAIATEIAFAFRFTAERLYELGYLNRLVDADQLMPEARAMANHLLSLPPASRVNTLHMTRAMRGRVSDELESYAKLLHQHGALSDRVESRKAFAEKRKPNWKGWDNPGDRARTPKFRPGKL
jgi:enoyl-CoA hydratase/carnithine racemase